MSMYVLNKKIFWLNSFFLHTRRSNVNCISREEVNITFFKLANLYKLIFRNTNPRLMLMPPPVPVTLSIRKDEPVNKKRVR
jgi:hypothetical protein